MWAIVLLSVVCNALLLVTIFLSPAIKSSAKQLVGLLASANLLTGLCSGALAVADTLTFANFAEYGVLWESGVGCKLVPFLSVLSAEAAVFLLTAVTVEQGLLLCQLKAVDARTPGKVKLVSALCFVLAAAVASLPLLRVGEYGANSLCLPMPSGESSSAAFSVTVVLLNSFCYFVMTVTHVKLYCRQGKGLAEDCLDCCWVKHVARLLFTNCLLFFPVAFLSFAGLLNFAFVSAEVVKSIVLVVVPLPACMNPLLYMLLNPHFKEDLSGLCSPKGNRLVVDSEAAEEKSCDSTQSLVTETSEAPESAWPSQQSLACTAERCPLSRC